MFYVGSTEEEFAEIYTDRCPRFLLQNAEKLNLFLRGFTKGEFSLWDPQEVQRVETIIFSWEEEAATPDVSKVEDLIVTWSDSWDDYQVFHHDLAWGENVVVVVLMPTVCA